MIDKIKAEIEKLFKEGDALLWNNGYGNGLSKCLKWAEELEKKLKEELRINNKVCGQALLNRKDEGYTVEHIFDNFFKRMIESIEKAFHGGKE